MEAKIKKQIKKGEGVVKGEGQHVYSTEDLTPPLHPTPHIPPRHHPFASATSSN